MSHCKHGYTHGHTLAHAEHTQVSTGPEVPSWAGATPSVPHTPYLASPAHPPTHPPTLPRQGHLPMKLMASGKN